MTEANIAQSPDAHDDEFDQKEDGDEIENENSVDDSPTKVAV